MPTFEFPASETVLLYARHVEEECPVSGILELAMNDAMVAFISTLSQTVQGSGLETGTQSVRGEALKGMRFCCESGGGVEVLALENQQRVPVAIGDDDGSVHFRITIEHGRDEYVYESDYIGAETIDRLAQGWGLSPGDLEVDGVDDLYFSGEFFRGEATVLYEEMVSEVGHWSEPEAA